MDRERLVGLLAHWRTWWDLATVVFGVWLLAVLFGTSHPAIPAVAFRLGLPASVGLFFVGFGCLAWRQRGDRE
ncbi:hypothetical protein [Halorussus marinus]|uniref:hypothetical protein n=1 Tax=Halorussus marinus TaxID=2505976 RepID=UPI001091EE22|nr:hypothetical protein [Halorussus marinus]